MKNIDWENNPLGKNWWVRRFRNETTKRLERIESHLNVIKNSLGLVEPEEGEIELSLVERIEELEMKVRKLEENKGGCYD